MKISLVIFFLFITFAAAQAQEEISDSTLTIDTVTVRAFEQLRNRLHSPIPVSIVTTRDGDFNSKLSLVNGLNQVTGVRMEERSPGSYRLNIRGSSLRSPFGVRNIRIYWNDIPVTDPGGNTYFNQFAWNNFSHVEVFRGPAGSLYGAGTGGLLLLQNFRESWQPGTSVEYITGSYGLHNLFASVRFGSTGQKNQFSYAHNQTNGYRVQSRMRRDNFSWISQVKKEKYELTGSVLFTDMHYETPGGLTLTEFNASPKAARPAAGGFPSAVSARAAIDQVNGLAGLSQLIRFNTNLSNSTTLYGTWARIRNPAIRNYEKRTEPSFGGRTFFSLDKRSGKLEMHYVAGAEFQQGFFSTRVFSNLNGNPDTLQTDDAIDNRILSLFAQADVLINNDWHIIAGASITKTDISVTRKNIHPVTERKRSYRNELAPKLSLMKKFGDSFHWLFSVSRGFSPPTVAEVLPSTGVISTELEAEYGWNYETTLRSFLFRRRLMLELTGFYFKLNDALVQRRDISGADFFVNAGDVKQKGLELHADYRQQVYGGFIRNFSVRTDITLNHFRYGSFIKGSDDFSGKKVPSVPSSVIAFLADMNMNAGFYLNASYYGASSIYLNDANTAKADPYHLLGCRAGWRKKAKGPYRFSVYAGIDNLLDETYSLGNDINAAAGRYYNAAPRRNFYAGISFRWIKPDQSN